jgi:hypothetical protein
MVWIERITVDIAATLISTQLLAALWPAMTTGAKTLERVQPKSIDVISVRHDVINTSCRLADAMSQTHIAQRLNK